VGECHNLGVPVSATSVRRITIEASRSSTRLGTARPAAVAVGSAPRVSHVCAHRQFPHLCAGRPQPDQHSIVHTGQHPPRVRVRGHRPEQARLVAQHRQVRDRLTTIGDHHRHVDGDPARVIPCLPLPQPSQRLTERAGQPGHLGDIGHRASARVCDHTASVRAHSDLRAFSGSLHLVGAFRLDG
jgi:hypothetical protein